MVFILGRCAASALGCFIELSLLWDELLSNLSSLPQRLVYGFECVPVCLQVKSGDVTA